MKTAALLLFALAVACTSGAVVPAEDAGVTSAGSDAGADAGAAGGLFQANADGECPPEHARRVGAHAIDAKRRCRMPGEILGCQDASWNLTECRVRASTGLVYSVNDTMCLLRDEWRNCTSDEGELFNDSSAFPVCP